MAKENINTTKLLGSHLSHLDLAMLVAVALMIFGIQFLYYGQNLPLGFEMAKADAVKFVSLVALLPLVIRLYKLISLDWENMQGLTSLLSNKYKVGILVLALAVAFQLVVATANSPYLEVAVNGNPYRYSGLIMLIGLGILFTTFSLIRIPSTLLKIIIHFYLLFALVHALIGIVDFSGLSFAQVELGMYVNGNFGQANFFANTLAAGAIIAFIYCINALRRRRVVIMLAYALSFLLLILVIGMSYSYGTWVVLPIVVVGFLVSRMHGYRRLSPKNRLIGSILFLVIAASLIMLGIFYTDEARRLTWDAAWQLIKARPLTGYGADTLAESLKASNLLPGRFIDRAHNIILEIAYNWGILIWPTLAILISLVSSKLAKIKINLELGILISIVIFYFLTDLFHTKSIFHYAELMVFAGILVNQSLINKSRN